MASRQYGEMCTSRTLYIFTGDITHASTEKNTQQFQALNGLKCSTVGNLGSQWSFVIMLLGFTHFLEDNIKNDQIFHINAVAI